jgi:type I restriction enzyme S subunit
MSGVRIDDALPRGWSSLTLADLCDVITDGTHYTPHYVNNGVPFFSVENVTANNFLNVKYITKSEHLKLIKRCRPQRGDILMTRIGSLANTKLIDWDMDASIYVSLALLRPGRRIDTGYLYAYTKSAKFVRDVEDRSLLWATPKKINMGDIGRVPVVFPLDRREQQDIGNVFREVEKHIISLKRLIAKKQAIKQGMAQQLLTGKTRLPGFSEHWLNASLGEVSSVTMGQSPPSSSYNFKNQGLPLVQGNADIRDRRTIDRLWTTKPTKRCNAGDVLLTVRAPVGYTAIASQASCLGRGVCSLTTKGSNRYLYHALIYAEPRWVFFEQGSTFTAVNSAQVRGFTIPWPSDSSERRAIAMALDSAELEIQILHTRLAKAEAIAQGMMQELLTGRTRLPVAEAVA